MMASHLKPGLRPYLPADAPICAAIAEASIAELTGDDYTEAQQEAWIASFPGYRRRKDGPLRGAGRGSCCANQYRN